MTTYRSSSTLRRLVSETRELTVHNDIREHIDAALKVIDEPSSGRYGRGRSLVLALEAAGRAAVMREEWEVIERHERFADYASGELSLNVLEMHYDEVARARQEQFMRSMARLGALQAVSALDALCEGDPDASAVDAREFFRGVARSIDHLSIGSGDGGVRLTPQDADRLMWIGRMELVVRNMNRLASSETARLLDDLLSTPDAGALAQLVELRSRQASLDALRAVIDEPTSSEGALHARLKNQEWIFGGAYVGEILRRRYAPEAILDIPLLRGDGSLHVVELKRANINDLLVRRSGHVMLGAAVHHAVSQAENYLRTLDEDHARILAEFGIETRRASATVVIGHPMYLHAEYSREEVGDVLRTYNSHLSRLEVITYETLVDSATRMLALSSPERPVSRGVR